MLTDRGTELRTEEEARMGLSRYEVGAGLAVTDMYRAGLFLAGGTRKPLWCGLRRHHSRYGDHQGRRRKLARRRIKRRRSA